MISCWQPASAARFSAPLSFYNVRMNEDSYLRRLHVICSVPAGRRLWEFAGVISALSEGFVDESDSRRAPRSSGGCFRLVGHQSAAGE